MKNQEQQLAAPLVIERIPASHKSEPKLGFFDDREPIEAAKSEALRRSVYIESKDHFGSGVIISTGLVVTALHFLKDAKRIKVNGRLAKLVHSNRRQDLAALVVSTENIDPVRFVTTCEGQWAFYVGNVKRSRGMFRSVPYIGRITMIHPSVVCADMVTERGSCGAGLWSCGGLVGLLDSDDNVAASLAVPAMIVKRFVAGTYRKLTERDVSAFSQLGLPYPIIQGRLWEELAF